ncbi:hypothetical protein C7N43_25185 [Sphingobacteriales bacterium UPWRP_1]|nr:hypothetical protein BVG80_17300 [Sphingobacteriales bacterium TSM_CSM]PSJ74192.1 hypothetical protein C7N43_25185 [Sphingobacteriales bacterium UPWRP_1]
MQYCVKLVIRHYILLPLFNSFFSDFVSFCSKTTAAAAFKSYPIEVKRKKDKKNTIFIKTNNLTGCMQ